MKPSRPILLIFQPRIFMVPSKKIQFSLIRLELITKISEEKKTPIRIYKVALINHIEQISKYGKRKSIEP